MGASLVKCGVEETEQRDVREGSGFGCRVQPKAAEALGSCIGRACWGATGSITRGPGVHAAPPCLPTARLVW